MKEFILDIFTLRFMPCHRIKERSLVLRGKQFPVCYRCMFLLIGMLCVIPILYFRIIFSLDLAIPSCVALNIPMLMDGWTQRMDIRRSNNLLRAITGLCAGLGLSILSVSTAYYGINTLFMFLK
ncbi:putative membrane protein [Bacillus pakistanensis]|uniref:Membrane protein n=1 Tax=Rossellomorea pakistanensis TaxID=992288 RepID=A0ABS2N8S0_9BACI|nr:DUF2085 domain-containing protein [Bacillus pakistanensis]MBM7584214.1 putative membrane protein [Bacillus pakistanensis]